MEKQKIKGVFFIAVVAVFAVFNFWVFATLNELTSKAGRSGMFIGMTQEALKEKIAAQRQFIYIGNGILAFLSLGGYFLFLKEQKN